MNGITISLIFLIVISMVLPTSAIMYASGQSTDNSDGSSSTSDNSGSSSTGGSTTDNSGASSTDGGTTDNSGSTTTTDNSGSSTSGGGTTTTTTDNSGSSSTTTSTQNNAALPSRSTVSNNTGNVQQESVDIQTILNIHNRERASISAFLGVPVPPLVWSDKLAADAKPWAMHLATIQNLVHDYDGMEALHESENIVATGGSPTISVAHLAEGWVAEKRDYHTGQAVTQDNYQTFGHYTQMVWKDTKEIGCAAASNPPNFWVLDCRYSPPGNVIGQKPY